MHDIQVTYFDGKGRAEPIRLALTIGNIPFKDNRVDYPGFQALKASGSLPFGSLPVMSVDGKTIAQSLSLIRFAGKLAGLYPKSDDILALQIDQFCDGLEDALAGVRKSSDPKDRLEWANVTGAPRYFGALEKIAENNHESKTWVLGSTLTVADIALYVTFGILKDGFYEHVPKDLLEKFPRLLASFHAVHTHPKVVEWNKTHPWKTFT